VGMIVGNSCWRSVCLARSWSCDHAARDFPRVACRKRPTLCSATPLDLPSLFERPNLVRCADGGASYVERGLPLHATLACMPMPLVGVSLAEPQRRSCLSRRSTHPWYHAMHCGATLRFAISSQTFPIPLSCPLLHLYLSPHLF
jgi:hypothetical protein